MRSSEVRSAQEGSTIRISGLSHTYAGPPPVEVLKEVDLDVRQGEYVAIVGPSGSGKSTLLNILGLLDRHTSGTYALAGQDVSGMTERKRTRIRAQHIGFVFQAFHLMPHRTALENVAMAGLYKGWDRSQRTAAAFETLTAVGLSHRLDAIPATMSGGERQRVAIARAFCTAPSVLLCDEPTGNLDSVSAEAVLTLLEDLNRRGATMIVITHDRDVAHRASRLLSIRDGRLSEVPRAHT